MNDINAELISIGNEILAGYTINTNAAFISQKLVEIGITVKWITTIADEPGEITYALHTANNRARLIIVTGGLGPTPDDITKQIICNYFETGLIENKEVQEDLEKFLKDRKRSNHFLKINKGQTLVPAAATIIRNNFGTAPGLILEKDKSIFCFMPGVPIEMKEMMQSHFINYLTTKFNLPDIKTHIMRTTSIAEAQLHHILKEEINEYPQFQFAFLPRQIGVDMRFRLTPSSREQEKSWLEFIAKIRKKAQNYIFTEDERNIEEIIVELLKDKRLTLSIVESFSGGLLQDWITNVPGSSTVFLGGNVTYSNASKIAFSEVSSLTLKEHGAVSKETALEMVRGVQQKFSTDCAISTTGIAGPSGGSDQKPVGLCFIAARYREKELIKEFHFGNNRLINKMRGAMAGLELLRRLILGIN